MVVAGKQDRSSGIAEQQKVVAAGKWERSCDIVEQLDVVVVAANSTMALVVGQQGHIGQVEGLHDKLVVVYNAPVEEQVQYKPWVPNTRN